MAAPALILLCHGSRDPRWAMPFARILARVQAQAHAQAPMLAFLELMEPDLAAAVATQAGRGFASVRIVPLFLGQGGHLREDVPRLVDELRAAHPRLAIELVDAAGEDDEVIAALARYCFRS
jgi:sirohydrochlorin cobaltochelatase